jgi:ABC-2 type transport system permease protein
MNKILIIARREYLATVRRKAFIIITVGMPIFFVALFGLSAGASFLALRSEARDSKPIGIVDEAHVINFQLVEKVRASFRTAESQERRGRPSIIEDLPDSANIPLLRNLVALRPLASREEARAAYLSQQIRGFYIFPPDFLATGEVGLQIKKAGLMANDRPAWPMIERLVQASLLEGKVSDGLAQRIWTPAKVESIYITDSGEAAASGRSAQFASFAVPYFFTMFFMMSILGTSGYLLQGVAEEKENRVIEMLVSSVSTDHLLAGKVLGLCGAGLTQLMIWVCMGVLPSAYALPFLDLRWSQLAVAVIFFLLGFLLFGTLMGGCGALGNNYRESQQLSVIWTLSGVCPLFFLTAIMQNPNGALARTLSYIPLTAPVTMMLRISAGRIPLWDIFLSAALLAAGLYFFARLGGKLFRLGVLMYGKRPTLVEIVRWLRAA